MEIFKIRLFLFPKNCSITGLMDGKALKFKQDMDRNIIKTGRTHQFWNQTQTQIKKFIRHLHFRKDLTYFLLIGQLLKKKIFKLQFFKFTSMMNLCIIFSLRLMMFITKNLSLMLLKGLTLLNLLELENQIHSELQQIM